MTKPLKKRDLIEKGVDALDIEKLSVAAVRHEATVGTVSQVNLPQVIEVAKFMSVSGEGVPQHCRGNVGICLRVTFQAVEWQMSPFSVADMSFIVNGRLAYMSQLLHAVVESRAPLRHRLDCEYDGEGPTRTCTVRGMFRTGDVREYQTPPFEKIRVKNSPLWKDDLDQQLFYYASRSWARKWVPDVLLGCYTKEELIAQPPVEGEGDDAPGLHARLSGAERAEEGHREGHAARELAQIAGGGQTIEHDPAPTEAGKPVASPKGKAARTSAKGKKQAGDRPKGKAAGQEPDTAAPPRAETLVNPASLPSKAEVKRIADRAENVSRGTPGGVDAPVPRTPAQYHKYAAHWIGQAADVVGLGQRWAEERKLRNDIGMTAEDRAPLEAAIKERVAKLEGGR